ncbi:MAG: hypothetical protein ACYC7E_16090 [Armatimonadota bacterium]
MTTSAKNGSRTNRTKVSKTSQASNLASSKNTSNAKQPSLDCGYNNIFTRISESFSTVYLTLISIILASVFGYFIYMIGTNTNLSFTKICFSVTAFLILVITWHEYMIKATAMRWMPNIFDTILPYSLGISGMFMVKSIFTESYLFYLNVFIYCCIGYIAFKNAYYKASKHPDNAYVLGLLGKYIDYTLISCLVLALIFEIFIILSVSENNTTQYTLAVLSIVPFIGFIIRGYLYWNLITKSPNQ